MKNEIYLKAGRVELSREEVQEFVNANRVYIVRTSFWYNVERGER